MLELPSDKLIADYIIKFKNSNRYFPADEAIIELIKKFPENKKLEHVLIKCTVINRLYSTNVLNIVEIAKHITHLNIDKDIKDGKPEMVMKIAKGHGIINSKSKISSERFFYSFATKYCHWHNENEYPIYDSYVCKMLIEYNKQCKFFENSFIKENLKDYEKYKKIYFKFIEKYKLSNNLKNIDKFLWLYGREQYTQNKNNIIENDSELLKEDTQFWNGYCPECSLNGEQGRMALNLNDFYECEKSQLQLAIPFPGVQAVVMNFRGKSKFRSTKTYADTVENGELLFLQDTDKFPYSEGDPIESDEQLTNFIVQIK